MVAVLGLKEGSKKSTKSKSKDKKAEDSDAQAFLKELEEKQKAAPDKCLFC